MLQQSRISNYTQAHTHITCLRSMFPASNCPAQSSVLHHIPRPSLGTQAVSMQSNPKRPYPSTPALAEGSESVVIHSQHTCGHCRILEQAAHVAGWGLLLILGSHMGRASGPRTPIRNLL